MMERQYWCRRFQFVSTQKTAAGPKTELMLVVTVMQQAVKNQWMSACRTQPQTCLHLIVLLDQLKHPIRPIKSS